MNDETLSYPTGRFAPPGALTGAQRESMIDAIAATPAHLRRAVAGLNEEQLDTPYRDGGWSVRQVAHHLPDSHVNAYIRFKLALTEDAPTIKPYDEAAWARLEDSRTTPIDVSLQLLDALHDRWVRLLRSMDEQAFQRKLTHPDHGLLSLDHMTALYAWHGRHHVAHITSLRDRMKWAVS